MRMSYSWERCDDCQEAIEKYGRENLVMCDMCTHLKGKDLVCACKEDAEEMTEKRDKFEYYCQATSHEYDRRKREYKLVATAMVYAYDILHALLDFSAMKLDTKVDYKSVCAEKTGLKGE